MAWRIKYTLMIGIAAIVLSCQVTAFADTISEGDKMVAIGDSLRKIRDYSAALELYNSAILLYQSERNSSAEAKTWRVIGTTYYNQGNHESAMQNWSKALQIYREIGDRKGEAKIWNNYGQVNSDLSDFDRAIEYFAQSLTVARELNDKEDIAIALQNLGNVYLKRSDYPNALTNYQLCLGIFRELGNRRYEMVTLLTTGSVYLYLCDYARAAEYYQYSYSIAEELRDPKSEADAMNNLGIVHERLEEYEKALSCYEQSLALCRELHNRNGVVNALNNIGVVYSGLGDYPSALDYYRMSLLELKELGDRVGECSNLLNVGEINCRMGKYAEGDESIQRGLDIAQDLGAQNCIQIAYQALGDCHLAQGRFPEARLHFAEAISSAEGIRGKLSVEAQKRSYASGVFGVYDKMISLLFADHQFAEAFNYVERARARSFLDILAGETQVGKSLHSQFLGAGNDSMEYEPELKSVVSQQPLTLPEVQSLLDAESTLLEYFLTENEVLIWVITRGSVDTEIILLPADSLQDMVDGFRQTIHWRGSTDYLSRELQNILIRPVIDRIRTERLIIVPHGILHYLPFHALQDQDGRFLFERYQISFLPSASVMKYLPQRQHAGRNRMLAFGNPSRTQIHDSIQYSEMEVKRIGNVFPNSDICTGGLASESLFRKRAGDYDILHLACHTELNSSYPLYSGLLLASGEGQDGQLDVYEIFSLDLQAQLVVLSSCETGLGHLTTGDELVGLSRAFLCAGAQALVCSLWEVNDESTGYFMERFYRNLQNHSKIESLQMAQADTKEKYEDIYYWAPFVLIGGVN